MSKVKADKKKNKEPEPLTLADRANLVIGGLKKSYFSTILPLEQQFLFSDFHSTPLSVGDFDSKPIILLIGQYSTGKTTFIKYIIGRDFPGERIGPEPTTDRFMAVQYGDQERIIPGNTAASQPDKAWSGLQRFGVEFLNRFECSEVPAQVLQEMILVDTPGILAGEKQRLQRGYDFVKTCRWFAERADKILFLFDAHKLDISDECKRVIEAIQFAHNKVSVILNKADMITGQELMRVYGALLWSLGKIIKTPEVTRVYASSFWDQAKTDHSFVQLFKKEREDLLNDLRDLPKTSTISKVNEVVKRGKLLKVHVCILNYLKNQMPLLFGKAKKIEWLLENLDAVFVEVQKSNQLAVGDFPNLDQFREQLKQYDFSNFPVMKPAKMKKLDLILGQEIPKLIEIITIETKASNPFDQTEIGLTGVVDDRHDWGISVDIISKASAEFDAFEHNAQGRAPGIVIRNELEKSKLSTDVLRNIWNLASIDGKGSMDKEEYIVAKHLLAVAVAGKPLPSTLPLPLVPPSKRSSPIYT